MDYEMFEIELNDAVNRMRRTLTRKIKVYSPNGDILDQFKRAGFAQNIPPEEALVSMMMKHIVKLSDMVKDPKSYDLSKWNETIGDARNYLFLLEALVRDEE